MFLLFSHALCSTTTVSASSDAITRHTFSVTTGDYVVVTFPEPGGFIYASKPNPTSFNVAQGCTDPCSRSCSWFHHDTPGIVSIGRFPGLIEYRATSSGTLLLTYGYTSDTSVSISPHKCTEIYVNVGPTSVSSTNVIYANTGYCFFESDITGSISSSTLTLPVRGYDNSGFSRVVPSGTFFSSLTGVVFNTTGRTGPMGFSLSFTSSSETHRTEWLYRYSDSRVSPGPIVCSSTEQTACAAGRDGGAGSCSGHLSIEAAMGIMVGATAVVATGVVLAVFLVLRRRRQTRLMNDKLLATAESSEAQRA
jgi:hypothetical protein